MQHKVNQNPAQLEVISALESLASKKPYEFRKGLKELQPEEILKMCCLSWKEAPSAFTGKINHSDQADKIKKVSYLWACYYFSYNFTGIEVVGCSWKMYHEAKNHFLARIRYGGKFSEVLIDLALSLNKHSKGRLQKLAELDPMKIKGISEWNSLNELSQYQRSKIPLRDEEWFHNVALKETSAIAHSTSSDECLYCYLLEFRRDVSPLMQLQSQGYRFCVTNSKELDNFRKAHPICDKCFKKNACNIRGMGNVFGLLNKDFECFIEPADQPLKIDIELLYEMPTYRLQ